MNKRTADQIIKHLAYHVNGDEWINSRYRHNRHRVYCVSGALAAAEMIGKQSSPMPEFVYRKMHRDQLAALVPGKIVCTTDCPTHAAGFDLQYASTNSARPTDWVVVKIEKFGRIIDVEAAFKEAALWASETHRLAANGYLNGGNGDEGEHVVVLAQSVKIEHVLCCNNPEFLKTLTPSHRRKVLAFARKHTKHTYRNLKEANK